MVMNFQTWVILEHIGWNIKIVSFLIGLALIETAYLMKMVETNLSQGIKNHAN